MSSADFFTLELLFQFIFRYEIRDDRKKDFYRFDSLFETLRNDILGAIWEKSRPIPRPRPTYPSNFNPEKQKTAQGKEEPSVYNSFHAGPHSNFKPGDHETPPAGAQNSKPDFYSAQTGNNFVSLNHTAKNYTTTKVESYLSHLGDSFSSQTTDNFLSHNACDSIQSRDYVPQGNTSYGYNLYTRAGAELNQRTKLLTSADIELIKLEIMSSLKSEIQDTAKEVTSDLLNYSNNASMLPTIDSELYQTHLYTQL